MGKLIWIDSYATKNQDLDVQHRRIIDLINELDGVLRHKKRADDLENLLAALVGFTQIHFTQEEQWLASQGDPRFELMQADRARFLKLMGPIQHWHQTELNSRRLDRLQSLVHWFLQHVEYTSDGSARRNAQALTK
jgi:hemerythrin